MIERHLSYFGPGGAAQTLCSGQSLPIDRRKNDGTRPLGRKPILRFKARLAVVRSAKKRDDVVQACNRHFLLCNFRLH